MICLDTPHSLRGIIMADQKLRKLFSENLSHYLSLNGYKQADLARHLKVSTATTAKWCTGQTLPRIDKIQAICDWLGIEKNDLLEHDSGDAPNYYFNKDARELAQFLYDNPDYSVLFDASRKVKAEYIDKVRQMIELMSDSYHGDDPA